MPRYIAMVSIFWTKRLLMDSRLPISGCPPPWLFPWLRGMIRCPLPQTSHHCLEKPPTTQFIILLLHWNSPRVGFPAAHWGLLMEPKWLGLTLYRFLFWNCFKLLFDSGMSVKALLSEEPANSKRLCRSAGYLWMDSDRGADGGILSLAWKRIHVG